MPKKILITGGAGFIGLHLGQRLARSGDEVVLCDNLFRGAQDVAMKNLLQRPGVSFINCDLTQPQQLSLLGSGYTHLYHLAAINGTKNFYEIPEEVLRVNILAVLNIMQWWFQDIKTAGKALFASSSETYAAAAEASLVPVPTPENIPLMISDVYNPRFSYAISKIAGESVVINFARRLRKRFSIVRFHNVYGPRMGFDHVIPMMSLRIAQREDPFVIYGAQQTRAFCYVDDATEAAEKIMESTSTDGKTINIGDSDGEIAMQEVAQQLFKISGFHPKIKSEPPPAGSVSRRCPDTTLMKTLTGFSPKIPLGEGLKRTFSWYLDEWKNKKRN